MFIYKYQNLTKIDEEYITELDKEVAREFINNKNGTEVIVRNPISTTGSNVLKIREITKKTNTTVINKEKETEVKIGDKVINQIEYKKKNNLKSLNNVNPQPQSDSLQIQKELNELKKENIKLKQINQELELKVETLTVEVENVTCINKEYESMLDNKTNKQNNNEEKDTEINNVKC